MARAAASLGALPPEGWPILDPLLALIEPRLRAQGSVASGALTLDNGDAVSLSGTHSGGTFHLTGDGYTADVSASGGGLAGTVTTPKGIATVAPMGPGPSGPPPANAEGIYRGSYEISVDGYFTSHLLSTGALVRSCEFRARITGTVTARVYVPDANPNTWAANIQDAWREVNNVDPACPDLVGPAERTVQPDGPLGHDYTGDLSTIQGARVERSTQNGLTNTRSHTFFGSVTAAGLEARISKALHLTGVSGNVRNAEGYPTASVTLTLVK